MRTQTCMDSVIWVTDHKEYGTKAKSQPEQGIASGVESYTLGTSWVCSFEILV